MKDWFKRIVFSGLAIFTGLSVLSWPACGIAAEKTVIVGDYSTHRTLDPAFLGVGPDIHVCRGIFQSLVRYKFNTSEIEGDLAKSWTISNDGLVYTFKLREDVSWHKGFGKFTANDVKFSFERVLDPKVGASTRSEIAKDIKNVRVLDDYTVEIQLHGPSAPFLHRLVGPRGSGIVCQKAMEKLGKDYARNPIGTGPYIFDSWTREQIVLVANKDFKQREGPPKIDRVINKTIPDIDTLVLALQKGDIDLIWILPREQAVLDRLKASGRQITYMKRPTWQSIFMNNKKKPFDDVRVRRAVAHAIDKDALIKYVLSGIGERLDSLIPKGFLGHTEKDIPRYDYNPQRAKELLAQAGYPNGFEVNFDTFNSPSYLPLATAIVEQLRKVNISLKLVVTDNATWWGKVSQGMTNFTLWLPSLQPDADFVLTRHFHSSAFSPGLNACKYDKIDDLIEKAKTERNEKKRLELYYQIQRKLMEDLPAIPLMMMPYPTAYKSHISGIPERDMNWGIDFYYCYFSREK